MGANLQAYEVARWRGWMEGSEVVGCKLARLQGGQVVRVQSGLICKVAMLQNDIILTLQGTKLYTGQGGEVGG
jgi:hypothetical protein